MIPISDVIPSRTTPFVTVGLIVLNAIIFLYEQLLPAPQLQQFVAAYALIPASFAWPALFTSQFLHAGWMHVISNMLYLWIFGDNVEDRLGHARYLLFYLGAGALAAILQTLFNPYSSVPMLGASGAIAGVMGAYFVLYPQSRVLTLIPLIVFWEIVELPAIFLLGFWFLMQLFSAGAIAATANSQAGGVAFMAHVAGFVTGLVGVFIFRKRTPDTRWI